MSPGREQLDLLQHLYDQALLLQAHAAITTPIHQWRGAGARVLGGRLAMNLGAPRLGRTLHMLAWREDPASPAAKYYYARALLDRRGPLAAWQFMEREGDLPDACGHDRADWLSLRGAIAGSYRDFQTAEHWLGLAQQADPSHAWVTLERSSLLERQDLYAEALALARQTLAARPWYRPGVQRVGHLLQLLERDTEALEFLQEASGRLESGPVTMQLAMIQTEMSRFEDARRSWERATELCPLLEKSMGQWLAGRRSDAAYYCGDYEQAAALAREAKNKFHDKVAEALAATQNEGRRVILPVGFVRQHHMTCAPATLSALSRYWSAPADHLSLVEAICYDGTAAHSERNWAEMNGYVAREFTADWRSTQALIDAGIPFTFTTVYPTNSHLQAVIGYDSLRGTLLIRDPYERHFGEFIADATFEQFKSTGPRGMALAPVSKRHLLDGIGLPDQALYDLQFEVQRALVAHDRAHAETICSRMALEAPDHRLTWWARRSLAAYDSDTTLSLSCIAKLLEMYPDDANLRLGQLSCLRVLARREDRLALLKKICDEKRSDPIFREQYARELSDDARERPRAIWLLSRALRQRPSQSSLLHALAGLFWDDRLVSEAAMLYRFAACLDDKDESLARSWFIASQHLKQTDAVFAAMHDRFRRFAARSSQPARVLFWAYEQVQRAEEGFKVLDEAMRLRPEDGELLTFVADAHARRGRLDRASELLAEAEGKTRRATWLRTAASIATYRRELRQALEIWRQIAALEPLAMDAQRQVSQLLAETEGRAAALRNLEQLANQFPHNYPIHQLWIGWMRDEGPAASEPLIRRLIGIHPADAWARRELASTLLNLGRVDEAEVEAQTALRLEPQSASSHYFSGLVSQRRGDLPAARDAYRAAIESSVDADFAIAQLIQACNTLGERKEAVEFVRQQLVRQTIFGGGLLAYRDHARSVLEPAELLASLREALTARRDLWHAWAAVIRQLSGMGQLEEAEQLAVEATRRFPLLPRLWLDLANVRRSRGDKEGELSALGQTLELSPGWGEAVRELAKHYERAGELKGARGLLEQAIQRSPLEAENHLALAGILWKVNCRSEAVDRAAAALRLAPADTAAWEAMRFYTYELKRPGTCIDLAREFTQTRAGEARSWLVLASVLNKKEDLEERLSALRKAAGLEPRNLEAHDQLASLLAETGRYEEALAACRPEPWGEHPPYLLRGRAAWIEARRNQLDEAIRQMRAVVAEEPRYYWGLCKLADWHRQRKENAEYLQVATTLVQKWPLDAVAHGYAGEANSRVSACTEAKIHFREALVHDPDYEFAASSLFDLALEEHDIDEAARALALLKRRARPTLTIAREARLAAAARLTDRAVDYLRQLCRDTDADRALLEQVTKSIDARCQKNAVNRLLREEVTGRSAPRPLLARLLIDRLVSAKLMGEAGRLVEALVPRRPPASPVAQAAAQAWLVHTARPGHKARCLRFVRRHRQYLASDDLLWGWVGYALHTIRLYRRTVRWMSDWRSRDGAAAWMLVNLAEATRALGADAAAHAIHVHASALKADDKPRTIHLLWLAADAIVSGDRDAAATLLAKTQMKSVTGSYVFLRGLLDATLAMAPGGRDAFRRVKPMLAKAQAAHPTFRADGELLRIHRQCLGVIRGSGPGIFGKIWCLNEAMKGAPRRA